MVISVSAPFHCRSEVEWTCSVLFGEFYGLPYRMDFSQESGFELKLEGRTLLLPSSFFDSVRSTWLSPDSLVTGPVSTWEVPVSTEVPLVEAALPVLFGKAGIEVSDERISINVDVLGIIFFMLSRYEEAVLPDRDKHDRFPSAASIAKRAGFLHRPIVDEYVELLWSFMKRLWPFLRRKSRQPRTFVSCDVDSPYLHGCKSPLKMIRQSCADLLKRRSPRVAAQTLMAGFCGLRGNFSRDPYLNAISWIMDANEAVGNRVAFYFIAAHTHPVLDGCYNLDEPVLHDLLRRVDERGHEIGLHASYNSYLDPAQTGREAKMLRQTLDKLGVRQEVKGGRQHFLRWQTPTTARNWETAGMDYDSSLGFADSPGFRCGTCRQYTMYDVEERRPLNLRQSPLVVMECSVLDASYLGMGYEQRALDLMLKYKSLCKRFNGDFTLLWHNSHFTTAADMSFYRELIR